MFKWIRKKILKSIIEDIIEALPEPSLLKARMFEVFDKYKDEILKKIEDLIKDYVVTFIKKKLKIK